MEKKRKQIFRVFGLLRTILALRAQIFLHSLRYFYEYSHKIRDAPFVRYRLVIFINSFIIKKSYSEAYGRNFA